MRILILTNLYPNPAQPNRAAFNRQQFAALAQQHEVRVIAPVPWTHRLQQRTVIRDGIVVDHPAFVYPPGVMRGWHGHFYARSVQPAFEQAVKELGPDVVLASWAYPDAWAAVRMARPFYLPVVTKVHGSDVLMLGGQVTKRRRTIEALQASDNVIAVSEHLAGEVREMGVDRVEVVRNGVDTSLFHPGRAGSTREPLVLFVGNLVKVKGVDVLIDACARLKRRDVKFQCRIVGEGPLKASLLRRIAKEGLGETVAMIGSVPLDHLSDWYRSASVLALPSHSEGIPNVILEAQACGTPVVATRVGGVPEILGQASLVEPGDAEALSHAIERAMTAPRCEIPAARSWSESAAQLADVLQQAIGQRRKAAA